MRIISLLYIFLGLSISSFAEVKISVYEHMKFKEINTKSFGKLTVGTGIIEIKADEEDIGKVINLNVLRKCYMTNKKHWIEVENLTIEDKDKEFVLDRKIKRIKIYGTINKNKINKKIKDADIIEGKYVGATPIIMTISEAEGDK